MSLAFSHLLVLGVVGVVEMLLLRRALRLHRADDVPRLKSLEARFERDIELRAQRGLAPDWGRYQSEAERLFGLRDDRLRSLAAAALAVGLGGTVLALCVNLVARRLVDGGELDAGLLIRSLGVSLIGSLCGVVVNLVIVLVLLPRAEDRFAALAAGMELRLNETAERRPPQEAFIETLRQELALVRQSLNTEFASAFSTAITGFPQVVSALGVHVDKLAESVERQGASMGTAVQDLTGCAVAVAESGRHLQPAAKKLADATALLVHLPKELQEVIETSRSSWLESVREAEEQQLKELTELRSQVEARSEERERRMLERVREMQAAVAEVRDAVGRLPEQLAAEVDRTSAKLGTRFGQEARHHTLEMADHLERRYKEVLERIEHHEQQWRNNIGAVVSEILDGVSGKVQEGVAGNLAAVGRAVAATSQTLEQIAENLRGAHAEWSRGHAQALEGWSIVGATTGRAAEKLVGADGHLAFATTAIQASAEHLERVARVTEEFEQRLVASLSEVVASHLDGYRPIREEVTRMFEGLRSGQERLDGILGRQSEFVQRCIHHLMKGRQEATLEEHP